MAAWNERRLIRDVYDICFLLQMDATPDEETLKSRLLKPVYSSLVKKEDYFTGQTRGDFYDFIRSYVNTLSNEQISNELSDYLPPSETAGLALLFKAAFTKLRPS